MVRGRGSVDEGLREMGSSRAYALRSACLVRSGCRPAVGVGGFSPVDHPPTIES